MEMYIQTLAQRYVSALCTNFAHLVESGSES